MSVANRPDFSYFFDVGKDVLFSGLDKQTGTILCQTGDATNQVADSDSSELWQQPGFWSLPAAPTKAKPSCQTICLKRSDRDLIIGTRDLRSSAIYGNLQPGETCVGSSSTASQARSVYKLDGSISHATTDSNLSNGNLVIRRLTPKEDRFWSPWGSALHDNTGWHLRTWHGSKIDVGGLGLPAPFGAFSSSITMSADMINVDAALLSLGRDAGFTQAVVQALPLQVNLAALVTALSAIEASIDGLAAVFATFVPTGGTAAALASFALLTTATNTAIGAANTALGIIATPASTGGTATKTTVA
jgi:hypothetical protein